MSNAEFEDLLAQMPKIATAVSAFTSETIQARALEALLSAHGVPDPSPQGAAVKTPHTAADDDSDSGTAASATPETATKVSAKKAASKPKAKQTFTQLKQLDFNAGHTPFASFVTQKKPKSAREKCLLAVYWFEKVAELRVVTIDHVYTAFKVESWPVPSDLANTLQQAGSKMWLDSKKRDDLKVVVGGENYVEHSLPAAPKAS